MKKVLAVMLIVLLCMTCVFAKKAKKEKMELVIYSAGTEEECQAVVDGFNEKYPQIKCTIIQAGSGDIQTRVNTEWPKPEGDVIFLMGSENLDAIWDKLEPYAVKADKKIAAEYKDTKDATPRYYASSMPLQAIMYNTELLTPEQAPKSWKDLADPKYKGMIELANPATSGSAYAQLYQMYCLSNKNLDLVKKVAQNGTVYVSSSTKGPKDVARGEYAITVTGEANVAQAIADGSPVAYVHPEEGTGLRTEGCAILANCKNLEAAKLFMDFMTVKDGASIIAAMGRRPVLKEAGTPEHLPALKKMKFYEYNTAEASKLKKQLQAEFSKMI